MTNPSKRNERHAEPIAIGFPANELASGGSPTSMLVGVGGGGAGGFLGVAAVTATVATAPAWLPVAAGVAGGCLITVAATEAYEALVPQQTRDMWDEGSRDAGKAVSDALWRAVRR